MEKRTGFDEASASAGAGESEFPAIISRVTLMASFASYIPDFVLKKKLREGDRG